MNILTWNDYSNNGALQKQTKYGMPFSDLITEKPSFSFEYTDFEYSTQDNTFLVDEMSMTNAQKKEVADYLEKVQIPLDWVKSIFNISAQMYLKNTDWYILRKEDASNKKSIPEDILTKRKDCREYISNIKNASSLEQIEIIPKINL